MHILMIDDESEFLELMQQRFEKRNIAITTFTSGLKALDLLKKEEFDAVVLDVKMPEIDGLELLKRIKVLKPDLPVVVLSGHAGVNTALSAVETGAADYIMKPVAINDLIFRLNEIIKH
ncbi:response regulator [Desulfovibrio litoralis]|uniref:Response regulator receiver domain-containing protein n=1 Tax=Desulfovibrio litoralis DSM 11393 TaxID=1121455 RepID=A0A1M7T659_9BACT|nr:response regulator [Desulfovibrio litoralis]SHN66102.1 Response regulator receiver domain-containing protein [Desulfovibrio litoralis DSM 11393]